MNRYVGFTRQETIDIFGQPVPESMEAFKVLENPGINLEEPIFRPRLERENERRKSSDTEEERVGEWVALEGKINEKQTVLDQQLEDIDRLKAEIRLFAKEQERRDRQLRKGSDAARRRFNVL